MNVVWLRQFVFLLSVEFLLFLVYCIVALIMPLARLARWFRNPRKGWLAGIIEKPTHPALSKNTAQEKQLRSFVQRPG